MSAAGGFGRGYEDVDGEQGADGLLRYLDDVAAVPAIRRLKLAATEALELRSGDHVLEAGCGTGVDLADLLAAVGHGGRVVGTDLSAQAVASARRRLEGIELLVADVQALPFSDATFDAARVDRTLQHVEDPERALAELQRVLRPRGRLVVNETAMVLEGMTGEPEVQELVTGSFGTPRDEAWLPFMLPLLLRQAGFGTPTLSEDAAEVTDPHEVLAALRARPVLDQAVAEGTIDRGAADAWCSEVMEAVPAGQARLRLASLRFVAEAG